jgi:hypothetical protein
MDLTRARREDRAMHQQGSSDNWPLDANAVSELVARVVCAIDRSDADERDVLLGDLLCAAWPSRRAQDQ